MLLKSNGRSAVAAQSGIQTPAANIITGLSDICYFKLKHSDEISNEIMLCFYEYVSSKIV